MRISAFIIIILVSAIGIAGCSSRHPEERSGAGKYKAWVEEVLNVSKNGHSAAIVVIKENYILELYESGCLVRQFPVEFGPDPINDKKMEGDDCTAVVIKISWPNDKISQESER